MTTLQEIRERLVEIQAELADVAAAIDGLEAAPTVVAGIQQRGWPPTIRFADKEPLRQAFTEMMRRLGIEDVQPIGAEALQERIRKSGVKPEERLFSRGIIEMREE